MTDRFNKAFGICTKCKNLGFTFDRRCDADECAHAGHWVTKKGKDGKFYRERKRVMSCPPRPCSCKAGNYLRRELKAKAELQYEAMAALERERSR